MRTKPHQGFETLVPADLKAIAAKGRAQCTVNGTRHILTHEERVRGGRRRAWRKMMARYVVGLLIPIMVLTMSGCASHQPIVVVVPPIVMPPIRI